MVPVAQRRTPAGTRVPRRSTVHGAPDARPLPRLARLPHAVAAAMRAAADRATSDLDNDQRDEDARQHWATVHHAVEQGPRDWLTCPGAEEHEALADAVQQVAEAEHLAASVQLLRDLAQADDVRASVLAAAGECEDYLAGLLQRAEAISRRAGR